MDENKEIKKVFELYSAWNFKEAQELNNKILESFPSNMYAKRYEKILSDKLPSPSKGDELGVRSKSAKVRWKSLKCPHCLAKIPFSGLTWEQKSEIKKWNYNNLEIKCPYCHTKFILQKRKAQSRLWIKIWDIANIDWKKYRATGYVEYRWHWYEDWYSDITNYLEWILLWEDNSYYYFSEWYSIDDWSSEEEFELSKKIIPNFNIPTNFNSYTEATVKSIYWENSKNYVVWEKTILYDFKISWKNYIKEIEWAWSQKEAGIYEAKEISWKEAGKIFWKEFKNKSSEYWNFLKKSWDNNFIWWLVFAIIFWINFISLIPAEYIVWWIILVIISALFYVFKDKIPEKYSKIIYFIIALPIFSFFIFQPIFNWILENKEKIELNNLVETKKSELKFIDYSIMQEKQTSSTRYDYGGTKTYYERNIWLKFSVKTEEDKKIIEKIKNLDSENKIKKMFKWPIYKLK